MRFRFHLLAVVITASVALSVSQFVSYAQKQAPEKLDLLILHGKLIDGSGQGARQADVGIRGDRIVFVGDAKKFHLEAARTIDAKGLIVAPGSIDPHTHTLSDLTG